MEVPKRVRLVHQVFAILVHFLVHTSYVIMTDVLLCEGQLLQHFFLAVNNPAKNLSANDKCVNYSRVSVQKGIGQSNNHISDIVDKHHPNRGLH